MPIVRVQLAIAADDYLIYYQGVAREVVAKAEDGRMVRFPAALLRPYVSHAGIYGRFEIVFDARGKFSSMRRLDSG